MAFGGKPRSWRTPLASSLTRIEPYRRGWASPRLSAESRRFASPGRTRRDGTRPHPGLSERIDPVLLAVGDDENALALPHRRDALAGQTVHGGLVGRAVAHGEGAAALG